MEGVNAKPTQAGNSQAVRNSSGFNTTAFWGNNINRDKTDNTFRIGFQNFGGLPSSSTNEQDLIDLSLKQWISDYKFDSFGITEMNCYWPEINDKLQFKERMKEWWEPGSTTWTYAYNNKGNHKGKIQWGGVGIIN